MTEQVTVPASDPLVYNSKQLCKLLGVSIASLHRLKAESKLPRAQKLGAQLRWNAAEIREWVEAGMPDLKTWEAMRKVSKGRR